MLACRPVEQITPAPGAKIVPGKGSASPVAAGWERKWESVLAEGKKDGVVSVYTVWTAAIRNALTRAFKEKYGIDLEFSTFSRGPEVSARAQAEARAGLYLVDVYGPAIPPLLLYLKPEGLLSPVRPLLILPEVLDRKAWVGGDLPFVDKDDGVIGVPVKSLHPNAATVFVNWLLTKEGQSIFATNFGAPSLRLDASTKGIDPLLIPVPGVRYYGESEDALAAREKWLRIAARIMAENVK